jgi:hypothetical protein
MVWLIKYLLTTNTAVMVDLTAQVKRLGDALEKRADR